MSRLKIGRVPAVLVWAALAFLVLSPIAIAATSPYLAGRDAVYIIAGLAGIVALALLLVQPLLAGGYLPGLRVTQERRWHHWVGTAIIVAVALHVGGLYLTSPQDALDALLLVAPTPFSVYGVIGLWGVVLTALLVATRSRLGLGNTAWRIIHNGLAAIVVFASVVHTLMIEGTMGNLSKLVLCALVIAATAIVILHLRVLRPLMRNR